MPKPTEKEMNDVLNDALELIDEGGKWPGMSYEQGVEAALRWVMGDGPNPIEE